MQDENKIIPVSALLEGEYGEYDVFAGVPVVLNRTGASDIGELCLTPEELEKVIDNFFTIPLTAVMFGSKIKSQ